MDSPLPNNSMRSGENHLFHPHPPSMAMAPPPSLHIPKEVACKILFKILNGRRRITWTDETDLRVTTPYLGPLLCPLHTHWVPRYLNPPGPRALFTSKGSFETLNKWRRKTWSGGADGQEVDLNRGLLHRPLHPHQYLRFLSLQVLEGSFHATNSEEFKK